MLSSKPSVSYTLFAVVTSKITHWSQIIITNIIIMKKSDILWELQKCDRHSVSVGAGRFVWWRVSTNLQFVKCSICEAQ